MAEPGGAAVFAGRPGQTRRRRSDASSTSGLKGAPTPSASSSLLLGGGGAAGAAGAVPGLVEEWGDCVKSMGVSSRESWAYRGAIEKHLTNIMNFHEILKDLKVSQSDILLEKSNLIDPQADRRHIELLAKLRDAGQALDPARDAGGRRRPHSADPGYCTLRP